MRPCGEFKVGDQGVAWWAVCRRGRLSLWGGIAVGVWMIFGVGHDMCVFSEIGFWSSLYVFSLGGRLLNPTKPLWAWTYNIISHPHALPQTPQPKQMKSIMNQVRQMKMTINGHDSSSWKQQTKIFHWIWMFLHWERQLMAWQMDVPNNVNRWNQVASLLKWRKNIKVKISWGQRC